MPQHKEATEEQVDAAIDFVISNGAEDRAQTVSYSRVFEAAGLPPLKIYTLAANPIWSPRSWNDSTSAASNGDCRR